MADLLPCPMCGAPAEPIHELVPGKVWDTGCSANQLHHDVSVMSWTSAEHCAEKWNERVTSPPVAVQEEGDAADKLSAEQFLPALPDVGYLGDDVSYGYDSTDMRDYALEVVRAALAAIKGDQP